MSFTSEGTRGAMSGAMPWLLLAGGVVALALWIRSKNPVTIVKNAATNAGDALLDWTGYNEAKWTAPDGTTKNVLDYSAEDYKSDWKRLLSGDFSVLFPGKAASTTDVGILAPPSGGTPFADLVNSQSLPSRPLLNEPLAPAEHYSTVWNPAETAAIKAAHSGITDPLISSYNQVRQYDTNRYITPHGQPADFKIGDRYLDISPYGWVVYGLSTAYLGDPPEGKYHNLYGQGGSFGGLTHELPLWVA